MLPLFKMSKFVDYVDFLLLIISACHLANGNDDLTSIDPTFSSIYGPGLRPDKIRLPCHYFFVDVRNNQNESLIEKDASQNLDVKIEGQLWNIDQIVGVRPDVYNRGDGTIIVRFKLFRTFKTFNISVSANGRHLVGSPVILNGEPILSDGCVCDSLKFDDWQKTFGCDKDSETYQQIDDDIQDFVNVDVAEGFAKAQKIFSPGSSSFCHYAIVENVIYRECFGKYVDFNIFADAILLYLTKLSKLPDTQFILNLGDWPLVWKSKNSEDLIPIISWCKTDDHADILWPTYELTQASLECMGRQVLDMISVQGKSGEISWDDKISKAFFRGRDSNRVRLDLAKLGKNRSDILDVGITNYFFFRDEEESLGKAERMSFFDYFKFKYQISIDGTVAAYRLPFLLAGNSLVLKQDSKYKEHFYNRLTPYVHFVPFNPSNLLERLESFRSNDREALKIISEAQKFSNENLLPQQIFCYHAVFIAKWTSRLKHEVKIGPEMIQVNRSTHYQLFPNECPCEQSSHDEL